MALLNPPALPNPPLLPPIPETGGVLCKDGLRTKISLEAPSNLFKLRLHLQFQEKLRQLDQDILPDWAPASQLKWEICQQARHLAIAQIPGLYAEEEEVPHLFNHLGVRQLWLERCQELIDSYETQFPGSIAVIRVMESF